MHACVTIRPFIFLLRVGGEKNESYLILLKFRFVGLN